MVVRYRNFVWDSDRWASFAFRDDDIIISTPPKCGTTWTQMLCALLVFDSTEFDQPLAHVSPWLDMQTRPLGSVLAELEAQTHRRFIKTHTPLDGLPVDERVTYLCVGRDPRDVAVSWTHHIDNIDMDAFLAARVAAVGVDDLAELGPPPPPEPTDPIERFWWWVDNDDRNASTTLRTVLAHLGTFWDRRHEPNVHLFHYGDLSADLPAEMRRLADALAIPRSDRRLEGLAAAAQFDQMKARATELAPNSDQGFWRSTDGFFNRGTSGQWQELLDEGGRQRYQERVARLASPDLAMWAHDGWRGR